MCTRGSELLGDDLADALATPGDEGEFAFEVSHRPRYARLGTGAADLAVDGVGDLAERVVVTSRKSSGHGGRS